MEGSNYKEEIAEILIDIQSIKFSFQNPFILTSGLKSPVYVDCRKIISFIKERNIILNYAKNYFDQNKIDYNTGDNIVNLNLKIIKEINQVHIYFFVH